MRVQSWDIIYLRSFLRPGLSPGLFFDIAAEALRALSRARAGRARGLVGGGALAPVERQRSSARTRGEDEHDCTGHVPSAARGLRAREVRGRRLPVTQSALPGSSLARAPSRRTACILSDRDFW
jgi:hypothetical protein